MIEVFLLVEAADSNRRQAEIIRTKCHAKKNCRSVINSNGMGVRNLIGTAHFLAATTKVVRSFFIYGPRTKLDVNLLMDDKSER